MICRNFKVLESSPSCFSNPNLALAGLRLKEGEEVGIQDEDMSMIRIGNCPGASGEGEEGGFKFIKYSHF